MTTSALADASIILFASGKGGVGKSTLSAALAIALAMQGSRCLLIDGDVGLRSLDMMLGMQDRVLYEMADCLKRQCTLDQAIVQHSQHPQMHLLAAGQEAKPRDFEGKDLLKLFKTLRRRYDYLLIDGPAGLGRGLRNFLMLTDRVVLVATPDELCLRDTEKTARIVRERRQVRPELLLNRFDDRLAQRALISQPDAIAAYLDLELLGVVPQSEAAYPAMLQGKTLLEAQDQRATEALEHIAYRLSGRAAPALESRPSSLRRLIQWLRGGETP